MTTQRKIVVLGGDIEKTGDACAEYPVISAGFTGTDINGKVLLQRRFNFQVKWYQEQNGVITDFGDFEPRCVTEYWTKKVTPQIIDVCRQNAVSQQDGWNAVNQFLLSLEQQFPEDKFKIVFVSDNASYDVANIDYNLHKYCNGRKAMRYSSTGKYRSVKAADDMLEMASEEFIKEANARINSVVNHDHDPVNDSHFICLQYVEAMRYKKMVDESV